MSLADKMMTLRKRAGWSQEELAEKMGVTRQSVSKWEGGQSQPELDKILMLSEIFGVSTDFLLKEEIRETPQSDADPGTEPMQKRRRVTVGEAETYLRLRRAAAPKTAIAAAMCVLSPVALMLLGALSETSVGIPEGLAAGLGIAILLALVAGAVAIFLVCDAPVREFAFLDREAFEIDGDARETAKESRKQFAHTYTVLNTVGTVLCILSLIPLITVACMGMSDVICVAAFCGLLLAVAAASLLFVYAGTVEGSFARLLEEGDFSRSRKAHRSVKGAVSTVYWLVVVAVFFLWTYSPLGNGQPKYSWIIWIIGGLLYAALMTILGVAEESRKNRRNRE